MNNHIYGSELKYPRLPNLLIGGHFVIPRAGVLERHVFIGGMGVFQLQAEVR